MSKEKSKNKMKDIRVNTKHNSLKQFVWTYLVLSVLTAGQTMIYRAYVPPERLPEGYVFGMMGYWAIVTLIFCLVTARQRYHAYDKPMRKLSEAAKKVAEGVYSVQLSPLRKDGKKDYVDVMFEDFNKMVEELGSTEMMKSDFIASVSHEIKTPLSVIQSYAMALQKENLIYETRKEYTDTIISASQKLTGLVTNILRLNKLENQEILASVQSYDLCRQLSECALTFEELWEEKNITFEADIEDRAIISADESMLEIVWNNLFSNAIKFTEPGGTVKLTQTSDSDMVTVIVEDSGCGMNEETVKHIFDKFYQGDTSHSQEGNGLGLALSKKVIELIGGSVIVKSTPGIGTIFIVKFLKNK
ncbi:HAMP domain-containing histidine kinase [Neobacillus drentensis]|uniref:HAMP domain-containing sensor histidine kinase n=1 Tax=Neobacillus drentensis TaxID=220684 RepID=UPI001F3C45B0|nr:HAMP domain-containing sensor histidine kinase [Neobacillus drentensis]ULT54860.1 HAMP domain-containing histidine kinase [Neobacillus drentensis]